MVKTDFDARAVLPVFKGETDTHVLNEFAGCLDARGFVFRSDVPVETYAKAQTCLFHDVLLFFILEKFGDVIVGFETVQTVVIDINFPENSCFR